MHENGKNTYKPLIINNLTKYYFWIFCEIFLDFYLAKNTIKPIFTKLPPLHNVVLSYCFGLAKNQEQINKIWKNHVWLNWDVLNNFHVKTFSIWGREGLRNCVLKFWAEREEWRNWVFCNQPPRLNISVIAKQSSSKQFYLQDEPRNNYLIARRDSQQLFNCKTRLATII